MFCGEYDSGNCEDDHTDKLEYIYAEQRPILCHFVLGEDIILSGIANEFGVVRSHIYLGVDVEEEEV